MDRMRPDGMIKFVEVCPKPLFVSTSYRLKKTLYANFTGKTLDCSILPPFGLLPKNLSVRRGRAPVSAAPRIEPPRLLRRA